MTPYEYRMLPRQVMEGIIFYFLLYLHGQNKTILHNT